MFRSWRFLIILSSRLGNSQKNQFSHKFVFRFVLLRSNFFRFLFQQLSTFLVSLPCLLLIFIFLYCLQLQGIIICNTQKSHPISGQINRSHLIIITDHEKASTTNSYLPPTFIVNSEVFRTSKNTARFKAGAQIEFVPKNPKIKMETRSLPQHWELNNQPRHWRKHKTTWWNIIKRSIWVQFNPYSSQRNLNHYRWCCHGDSSPPLNSEKDWMVLEIIRMW